MSLGEGETNYSIMRENLTLGEWDDALDKWVERDPSNAEILKLLDALHADIAGTVSRDVDQILTARWFRS